MAKIFLNLGLGMVKPEISKDNRLKIKAEYKKIVLRAKDIGSKNILLSSYLLAAFFIALNRANPIGEEENYKILESGMRKSKLLKKFMGDAKSYFKESKMVKRRKWALSSHLKKYENDWVLDIKEDDPKYRFGINYLECGVCKLCRDEKCFYLAKYLCRLDYLLAEIMGLGLDRTMTLANGDKMCDFRWYEEK